MKLLVYSGLSFFMAILFAGCVKRELELPEGQVVRINFDWNHLADGHKMPATMQLRFYSPEGDFLFAYTSTPDHFQAHLPEGKYKILVYSPDTTGVCYEHLDNFNDAQITVNPEQKDENESEILTNIYGESIGGLPVIAGQSIDTTVTVHPYLHLLTVQLKITGSSKEVVECSTIINGVAQAVNLSTGLPVLGADTSVSNNMYLQNGNYQGVFRLAGNDDRYPSVIFFKLHFSDGTERIIQHNFEDFMDKIDLIQNDVPLLVELAIDVQLIDGVFTATLTDWIYKQGEVTLN